ncbi:MAG: hypothetical protein U1E62_21855 [Alsobacter sp.]
MRSIAAVVLTIAIALFSLLGSGRAVLATTLEQAQEYVSASGTSPSGFSAKHFHHSSQDRGSVAGQLKSPAHDTFGEHGCDRGGQQSNCCSLDCHALSGAIDVQVFSVSRRTTPVKAQAATMPRGSRIDGFLRPPRVA